MFQTKLDVDRHVNEIFRNLKSDAERNGKCYQIAKQYFKVNDYKSVIKYVNRYISTHGNSAPAHKLLGEAFLALGLKAQALDSFKTSFELDKNDRQLILKICELLCDPEVPMVASRYWLDKAKAFAPRHPVVFKLEEHLLKDSSNGENNNQQLIDLLIREINARPSDVTVRVKLLNHFMESKKYKLAYQHALELEGRSLFRNDLRWYDCLSNLVQGYENTSGDLGFDFVINKICFFERRADLSMQEFQAEVKSLPECSTALFAFDQALYLAAKGTIPIDQEKFFSEFLKHMRAQLSFHLATLALKRGKKDCGIWSKAIRTASPLLLQATQTTMDLDSTWIEENKRESQMKVWNKDAAFRISQAGHVLRALAKDKEHNFLEKVTQFCGGKWRSRVYQDVFYNKEHQQYTETSYFMTNQNFVNVPFRLLTTSQLSHFDDLSQFAYPDSLHHLVWLGLASFNSSGQLRSNFRCTVVHGLQFTVENLNNTGPETLNQLDVDGFLYASVLCARSSISNFLSADRPGRLPVSISEELCTPAQSDWWNAVYKTFSSNHTSGNISEIRLKLRKGIETIRAIGNHGLHVKLIVMLAKIFQDRAASNKNPDEQIGLEDRSSRYWTAALPLLEKIEKNQILRTLPNTLFDYKGEDPTSYEVKGYLEDGRLFLGCQLTKQGRHEEAINIFVSLKSPYASFHEAMIYKKLASEELNHRPESITSENRSQHIIFLTRARDALFLTLDRLRSPGIESAHPLNAQLHVHIEEIETQLLRIEPDGGVHRNGDAETDDSDVAPGPLSPEVLGDNLENSFNVHNASNFLSISHHQSTPRGLRHNFSKGHHSIRTEARPSPERLDAQLRHLVQSISNGLQSVLEELKEIKTELRDLKLIVPNSFAQFKEWNEQAADSNAKATTGDLKPEDLFEFPNEEDLEDINQLTQQYAAGYQNFPNYRQMPGLQGTSAVSYQVPPPVAPMLPPGAPIIPSYFSNARPIDPSLLLYQTLGYYAQGGGLPFSEGQNLPDFRGTGIQKGAPFTKNAHSAPIDLGMPTSSAKPQVPNIEITSDVPHHLKGAAQTAPLSRSNPTQVHAFQIAMPPLAQKVSELPSDKITESISPAKTTSILVSPVISSPIFSVPKTTEITPVKDSPKIQNLSTSSRDEPEIDPRPDYKPLIPLPDEVEVRTGEEDETKLFESRAKLFVFVDKEWKERGVGLMKVLHNEQLGKARIVMRRDQVFKICANHYVLPEMEVKYFKSGDRALIWGANDFSDGTMVYQKFSVRFKTFDEAKDFEFAFNKAREIARESAAKGEAQTNSPKTTALAKVEDIPVKNSDKTDNVKTNIIKSQLESSKMWSTPDKELVPQEVNKNIPTVPPVQTAPLSTSVKNTQNSWKCSCNFQNMGDVKKCTSCGLGKDKQSDEVTKLGGFTFLKAPVLKPQTLKVEEPEQKPQETVKPSPFAAFSFTNPKLTSTTGPLFTSTDPKPTNEEFMFGGNYLQGFANLAAPGPNPNAFKIDEKFKGFEGTGSLVFGNLKSTEKVPKTPVNNNNSSSNNNSNNNNNSKAKEEDETPGDASEFVPTAEFAPVVPLPDLVEVKTGEEGETVILEERAKILRFDAAAKEWKEKGVGMMKVLLNESTGKVRLLMRREQVFKVCCNHFLTENMKFENMKTSEKALTWVAQDYSEGDLKLETLAIRFGKIDTCNNFKKVIEETQKKLLNGRMIGCQAEVKPKQEEALKPLSEMFKAKPGTWDCTACYIKNDADKIKCIACETPKPGFEGKVEDAKSKEAQEPKGIVLDPSLATKFNFGIPQSSPNVVSTTKSNASSIFGDSATKKIEGDQPAFIFGVSSNAQDKPNVPFSFNALKTDNKGSTGTFQFSFSGVKPQTKTPSKPSPSGEVATSGEDTDEEHHEEDEGDHITFKPLIPLPDKVPVHTGEEDEEVLWKHRAKLYRYVDKQWKERGVGDVKVLKHKINFKIRLLMRRDQVFKLCLNHYLTKDMEFLVKDDKSWHWFATDYSEGEVEPSQFAIRFKSAEIAKAFKDTLDKVQKDMTESPAKVEILSEQKEPTEAMKKFTFSLPGFDTPKNTSGASVPRKLVSSSDDISIVYENNVTPEQRDKAVQYQLPPKFYSYLNAPKCSGCVGCEDDSGVKVASIHSQLGPPADPDNIWSLAALNFNRDLRDKNQFVTFNSEVAALFYDPDQLPQTVLEPEIHVAEVAEENAYNEEYNKGGNDEDYDDEDDDDDDDVYVVDDDDDEEEDEDIDYSGVPTLVLEKQDFILFKLNESRNKYESIGGNLTLQLFELRNSYFKILVEEIDSGRCLSETCFYPSKQTMFKMSERDCLWASRDSAFDPPEMSTLAIRFGKESDLQDFLFFFECSEAPENLFNSFWQNIELPTEN